MSVALVALLAALPAAGAGGWAGRPLADAITELRERGLDVFFTSQVVAPELRVEDEPTGTALRDILDEILAPHGLISEPGPGGRLVVVVGTPRPATLRGQVRERRGGAFLPGVRILIPGTDHAVFSAEDGTFVLGGVAVGRHAVEAHLPGFVVQRLDDVAAPPGRTVELIFELVPTPLELDEIVVTPSRISMLRQDPVAPLNLDRDDLFALPHYGDDLFRAFTLLPGVAGEEVSARFNVRGGRSDEVLVLLDRVELFEPYHLKDFSSALSIITPRALGEVNLITGGFPAQYGDRMSGVLDMTTALPDARRIVLGLGVINAEASGTGLLRGRDGEAGEARGHWLGAVRRGSLDLALEILGRTEKPLFWDVFGKLEHRLGPRQRLALNVLHSDDTLDQVMVEPDAEEAYGTSYGNSYGWLTHQAVLSERLFVDTVVSLGRVERDRTGEEFELEEEGDGDGGGEGDQDERDGFLLSDSRRLDALGVKQDWNWLLGERHYLKWGFDLRRLETEYDYFNTQVLEDPLADLRSEPRSSTTEFRGLLRGDQRSLYASDRLRLSKALTLELGLRYDEQTLTDDRDLSPRVNLVWALASGSVLRAAWGLFYQSQRPYELQVEDGVTVLSPAERTEQRVLGIEHRFPGVGRSGLDLRVEVYEREIRNPRLRFENIFEPVSVFPEVEPDRFRIAPERASAHGLEIFVRGAAGKRLEWWASYAYARVKDRLDGREVPRRFDQPHKLNFDLNLHLGAWDLNLAWRWHTGWPTTAFSAVLEEDDEGELEPVPVFGPLNGDRLPNYHRLDLRLSREWQLKSGKLGFFLEVQNAYDRKNLAGFDVDFEFLILPDGQVNIIPEEEIWGGILPSFGVTWEIGGGR